ncbi:MAG: D-2-hydroxyacid dehydrogenase [Planctomycetales bacterium]|nr:D-2-hydroxyacid dehydrogenase [Planctomycetales bacterium]
MPRKLLIYPAIDDARLQQIRAAGEQLEVVNAKTREHALEQIGDAEGFFGKLTPELLAAAERLTWVQSPTASLEHYIFPELVSHPATLTNMRGLFSDVIADHVMGYVLCFARNLHIYLRQQRRHQWAPCGGEDARSSFAAGPGAASAMDLAHRHLADDTMGIFGLGHIGREIARRARAFGMRVIAIDPYLSDEARRETPADVELMPRDKLPQLLNASDFVVIAAPHTPETAGLFGRQEFIEMKSTGVLINIGRGVIVRLDELTEALRAGELAGVGLDVFEEEPLPADHPLWTMEQAILTPHVAACSVRVPERHLETLLDNVRRFAADEPLCNVVRKDLWF